LLNPGKPLRSCDLLRIFISAFSSKPLTEPESITGSRLVASDLFAWAGGPSLHCTIPTEGAPSLRFLQGWAAMLPAQLFVRSTLSVVDVVCVPALRKVREGRGTRSCGGFRSLKAGPRAPPPALRFPERTRVALCSDLAHDDHQNCNFLFRLR
jgi:hypothetical protein